MIHLRIHFLYYTFGIKYVIWDYMFLDIENNLIDSEDKILKYKM